MRRIVIVGFGLLIVIGIVWFFFLKKPESGEQTRGNGIFQNLFTRNSDIVGGGVVPDTTGDDIELPDLAETSSFSPITSFPVAGYVTFDRTKTILVPQDNPKLPPIKQTVTEHYLRFVSRSNGYVYEIIDQGTPVQISNVYIPNIYEAVFTPDGTTVFLRFLRSDERTIATYKVPVPEPNPDGTRTQQPGEYLADNITTFAVSADGKNVAQITETTDTAVVTSMPVKAGVKRELLRTPFRQWITSWPTTSVYMQTKASASASGYLYRVDAVNKQLIRVLGNVNGLTASVSPKGGYVLYSESVGDTFETKLLTTKNNQVKNLAMHALPEKCVWLKNEDLICAGNEFIPSETYPDSWYMGNSSFADKLYLIYNSVGVYDTLDEGSEWQYDAVDLKANESLGVLYFVDKPSGILWQFEY